MYQFRLGKIGKELKSKANWIAPIALGIALLGIASQRVAGVPPVIATGEGAIAEAEIEPNALHC